VLVGRDWRNGRAELCCNLGIPGPMPAMTRWDGSFVVVLIGIGLAKCCVFVNSRWAFPLAVGLSLLRGA